jgi:hypothetical protein
MAEAAGICRVHVFFNQRIGLACHLFRHRQIILLLKKYIYNNATAKSKRSINQQPLNPLKGTSALTVNFFYSNLNSLSPFRGQGLKILCIQFQPLKLNFEA